MRFLIRLRKLVSLLGPVQAARFLALRATRRKSAVFNPCGTSLKLICRLRGSDIFVMHEVFGKGEGGLERRFRPSVVVDGGANVGYTTAYFASMWPEARIIAVEPDGENLSLLRENVAKFGNVIVKQAAIWKEDGIVKIANPSAASWSYRVTHAVETDDCAVNAYTIPSLLAAYGESHADIVKLDIEGAETTVFRDGPLSWLKSCDALIIEVHGEEARATVHRACAGAFACSQHGDKLVFIRSTRPPDTHMVCSAK